MRPPIHRRGFLRSASAALALPGLSQLVKLPPVSAAEAEVRPDMVRFDEGLEPTVRMLEATPRDAIIEQLVARIRAGLTYREVVASLLLAGIRNIPGSDFAAHRNVGGELHSIFVINSAHLASLASPDDERWFPILWAVDQFRRFQEHPRHSRGTGPRWYMSAMNDSRVPSASKARQSFIDAMEHWDEEAAGPAAAGVARSMAAPEAFELFCRFAARDFRYIGHKTIFVANAWRTLQIVGWQHAEPVLRSLARALTAYDHREGDPRRGIIAGEPDRAWQMNIRRGPRIRADWIAGRNHADISADLLAMLRADGDVSISIHVADALDDGIGPHPIWDAVRCATVECVMNQPNFDTVHAVTTANALHYLYQATRSNDTRVLVLLQAAAFATLFRKSFLSRDRKQFELNTLDALEALPVSESTDAAVDEIFADVGRHASRAAGKTLTLLEREGAEARIARRARQLVFLKGDDSHDYKYSSAVLEDCQHMAPPWRKRYLAAALYQLRGTGGADTTLSRRIKAPG